MEDHGDIMLRNNIGCPGNARNTRLHVVRVLPPTWLEEHRDVIAAVTPPPLALFTTSPTPMSIPDTASTSSSSSSSSPSSSTCKKAFHFGGVFPKHIDMLPNEIMLMIFSHLSPDDLEHNVSGVCTRWRTLTQHASLRRRVTLKGGDGVSTPEARRQLSAAKKLLELRLDARADIVPLMEEAAKSRCSLRKLIIKRVRHMSDRLRAPLALQRLLLNSTIEELTVSFSFARMLHRPFFTALKTRFVNMRKLNLSFIPDLCHDDLARIVSCCPQLSDLRVLMLRRHSKALLFNDQDLTLIGMLSESLEVLKIEAAHVTDVGMAILTYCKNLRTLCLRELSLVTDEGLQALLFFKRLQNLYLSGANNVSNVGWTLLFMQPRWSQLRKLALIQCSLSDQAASFLIPNYPCLRRLNILGCTELSNGVIKTLLGGLRGLEVVALCLSQIEGCIYWIPGYAPNIKKIIYHSCSYPHGPHIEMYEPFGDRRDLASFDVPSRSIILSLDEEADFDQIN